MEECVEGLERGPYEMQTVTQEQLYNLALEIVMEWGPNRRTPVELRIIARCRGLDETTAVAAAAEARAAEKMGHDYLWDRSDKAGSGAMCAPQPEMEAAVLAAHPWVDANNLSHLYQQSCYYVWHG